MADKEEESLAKLFKLTKMIKAEKISVAKKGEIKSTKWRSKEPKFEEKKKRDDLVNGGGMEVDAERKTEYDQWREEKEAEKRGLNSIMRRPPKKEPDAPPQA